MGSTPTYALPYPELTDSANVPRDQKLLAEATESSLAAVASTVAAIPKMASGTVTITTTATPGAQAAITFPVGLFSAPPKVVVARASGGAAKAIPYSGPTTAAGTTVGIYNGDGSNNGAGLSVPVTWLAIA